MKEAVNHIKKEPQLLHEVNFLAQNSYSRVNYQEPLLQLTQENFKNYFPNNYSEKGLNKFLKALSRLYNYAFKVQKINDALFSDYIPPHQSVVDSLERLLAEKSDLSALLVLGDSGTGKSMLAQQIVWQAWKNFKPGGRISLFIPLARIKKFGLAVLESELLPKVLTTYLAQDGTLIASLKDYGRWTLVFDGYDEIGYQGNLYDSNELSEWGDIKLVTTCRPEALPPNKSAYLHWFY